MHGNKILQSDVCVGDTMVTMHACHIRGHIFESYQRTSSERNGQSYGLSLTHIEGGRNRDLRQGGSMMQLPTQDEHWKKLS